MLAIRSNGQPMHSSVSYLEKGQGMLAQRKQQPLRALKDCLNRKLEPHLVARHEPI